jgi:hypothetical protein
MRDDTTVAPEPEEVRAYIPVRVTVDATRPDGSVLVYLPDGTGLAVNSRHLLFADSTG